MIYIPLFKSLFNASTADACANPMLREQWACAITGEYNNKPEIIIAKPEDITTQ